MRQVGELINSFGLHKLSRTQHGYKACCAINPAHNDSSPSMHIHLEKGHVKCFSCGAYRPLFDFLIDNGATLDEAIEFLFLKHEREDAAEDGVLKDYILGRKIPKSFIDRGFSKETLKHFGVGYDEYEKHITIPMRFNEKLVGIQYRKYPKEMWASDNFNKFNYIYNYEPTEERTYVEGFTDLWRTWQNGTKEVSATLGASVSEGQFSLMAQHKIINIAFDNDLAGYVGAFKIEKALGREVTINMIPYKPTDPGECSEDEWIWGLNRKTSFTEFEVAMIKYRPRLYIQIQNRLNNRI